MRRTSASLPGKHVEGGQSWRLILLRCVFALLIGLVCGYVIQSVGSLVRAVDNFSRNGDGAVFTAYRQ
jgi:hypothetical protein